MGYTRIHGSPVRTTLTLSDTSAADHPHSVSSTGHAGRPIGPDLVGAGETLPAHRRTPEPGVINVKTLLPLYQAPDRDAPGWLAALTAARARGGSRSAPVTAVVWAPPLTEDGGPDGRYVTGLRALGDAGVTLLGHVDLAYAARPLGEIFAEVAAWVGYPMHGIFFDRAPTTPFAIGAVAGATAVARRAG